MRKLFIYSALILLITILYSSSVFSESFGLFHDISDGHQIDGEIITDVELLSIKGRALDSINIMPIVNGNPSVILWDELSSEGSRRPNNAGSFGDGNRLIIKQF